MAKKDYRDLVAWQKAMLLVEDAYAVVRLMPREETFALSDQIRRAAISIPSNIAEGYARGTDKEAIRFLQIAQGSRAELETQFELCLRIGYITQDKWDTLFGQTQEVGRILTGLIKSIKARLTTENL